MQAKKEVNYQRPVVKSKRKAGSRRRLIGQNSYRGAAADPSLRAARMAGFSSAVQ